MTKIVQARNAAFICYSHKDKNALERLQVHLASFERDGLVEYWDDTRIKPGLKWQEEVKKSLARAKVAVLLISADFFASEFIAKNELPPLLAAEQSEGLTILQVIVSPSRFLETSLAQFQVVGDPAKPLIGMTRVEKERLWMKVARAIKDSLNLTNSNESDDDNMRTNAGETRVAPSIIANLLGGDKKEKARLTGFRDLDMLLGRLHPSSLYVLAGDIGVGKTGFALSLVRNSALHFGQTTAILTLEMSEDQILTRFLAMDSLLDVGKLRDGRVDDEEFDRFSEAVMRLSEAPIYYVDRPNGNLAELCQAARELVCEHGCELIIVDYLQLIDVERRLGSSHRGDELSEISRAFKALARELYIPIILVSQIQRYSRGSTKPKLSDLQECGSLAGDADVVLFIYRDELYNPDTDRRNLADIIIAKNRHGPTGEIHLYFSPSYLGFRDLELYFADSEVGEESG